MNACFAPSWNNQQKHEDQQWWKRRTREGWGGWDGGGVNYKKKHYFQVSESKKEIQAFTLKRSQKDNGCLSTAVPFRASFIYTLCSQSSTSPLLPGGLHACPDVQLFMWSSNKSSWPARPQSEQRGSAFSKRRMWLLLGSFDLFDFNILCNKHYTVKTVIRLEVGLRWKCFCFTLVMI